MTKDRHPLWRLSLRFLSRPSANLRNWDFWRRYGSRINEWSANEGIITQALEADRRKKALPEFENEFERFQLLAQQEGGRLQVSRKDILPCLDDRTASAPFDGHYTYHPAWAARILARTRPAKHVDISSILSFCTVLSAFIPVDFYDFRPVPVKLDNLKSGAADLRQLHFPDGSIASLSCMHVIEHIGLGRYGDPLQADGDLQAIRELTRVLAPGGNLLVAVPVGRPRVLFNAHRIYDFSAFRGYFGELELVEFALIPDDARNGIIHAPPTKLVRLQNYGCGCYWFKKATASAARGD